MENNNNSSHEDGVFCSVCNNPDIYCECDGRPNYESETEVITRSESSCESHDPSGGSWSDDRSIQTTSCSQTISKNSGDSLNDSGKKKKKFCLFCKKYGHEESSCFKKNPCSVCGKFNHSAKVCWERSTEKKRKGEGTRGTKKNDLNKSFQEAEDKNNAYIDALLDENEKLKQDHRDEKDEAKEKDEDLKSNYAKLWRFGSNVNIDFKPSSITTNLPSMPDISSIPLMKNKLLSFFSKAIKAEIDGEEMPGMEEDPIDDLNEDHENVSVDEDSGFDRVLDEEPLIDVIEESEEEPFESGSDPLLDFELSGIDSESRSTDDLMEIDSTRFEFEMVPPPSSVVDPYDEDPFSYTFTSPISYPDIWASVKAGGRLISMRSFAMLCCLFFAWTSFFLIAAPISVGFIFGYLAIFLGPFVIGWSFFSSMIILFFVSLSTFGLLAGYEIYCFVYEVLKLFFLMVRWKNTYTFKGALAADETDLRTDSQIRSEMRHKDAVYAKFTYSRRLHVSYTADYRNTGYFTLLIARGLSFFVTSLGQFVPGWLQEFDRENIVVSLEAFDQAKEFMNTDFTSTDAVACEKIKTSLKKIGTIWINRSLKTDPIYMTSFLVWAYFKSNQQKVEALPFHKTLVVS